MAAALRPPTLTYPWNGELRLVRLLEAPSPDAAPGAVVSPAAAASSSSVYEGVRSSTRVLIKRIPSTHVDGASVDLNIRLSAAMENEKTLHSGMVHLLQTLTCHHSRPSDESAFYVALEHCDCNLRRAVDLTRGFLHNLASLPSLDRFDEDTAPLLLWRARRSVARQLLSGVAFLHRTGIGLWQRIYHNNLHPRNVLLKNGIVKLSEVNAYSHSDAYLATRSGTVNAAARTPVPQAADTPSAMSEIPSPVVDLAVPRMLPMAAAAAQTDAAQQQQKEFLPFESSSVQDEMRRLQDRIAAALARIPAAAESPTNSDAPEVSMVVPPEVKGDMDRLYRLRSYRDSFAVACLIYFTLTLGKHPLGPLDAASHSASVLSRIVSGAGVNPREISAALASSASAAKSAQDTIGTLLRVSEDARTRSSVTTTSPTAASSTAPVAERVAVREFQHAPTADRSRDALPVIHTDAPPLRVPLEPRASHMDTGDFVRQTELASRGSTAASFRDTLLHGVPATSATVAAPGSRTMPGQPFFHQHYTTVTDTVDHEEAVNLIASLIDPNPDRRMLPADALAHPFFWSTARKFLLITLASEGTVVQQASAVGHHAAFASEIQRRFMARMPTGVTTWGPLYPCPPGCGASGWSSPLWHHREPIAYEAVYNGPYSMYSLIRFSRNLYVHGPEHVRLGLFESSGQLEAHILSAFPWLVLEIWLADQALGGRFTRETLAGGSSQAVVADAGVDADYDVVASTEGPQAAPSPQAMAEAAATAAADAADTDEMQVDDDDDDARGRGGRRGRGGGRGRGSFPRPFPRHEQQADTGDVDMSDTRRERRGSGVGARETAMGTHRWPRLDAYYPSDDEHTPTRAQSVRQTRRRMVGPGAPYVAYA